MKKTPFPFSLGLPVGAVLALLGAQVVQGPQAGAPPKAAVVGVVDFVKVFDNYAKFTKAMQELEGLFKQHQARLDQDGARLDELEITIKKLDPETRERAELELKYKLLTDELKGMRSLYEVDIQRGRYEAIADGYAEIEKAIHQVAKDKGVDLVLRVDPDPSGDPLVVRKKAYDERGVWYATEQLDLTPAVINFLKVMPTGQGGDK